MSFFQGARLVPTQNGRGAKSRVKGFIKSGGAVNTSTLIKEMEKDGFKDVTEEQAGKYMYAHIVTRQCCCTKKVRCPVARTLQIMQEENDEPFDYQPEFCKNPNCDGPKGKCKGYKVWPPAEEVLQDVSKQLQEIKIQD